MSMIVFTLCPLCGAANEGLDKLEGGSYVKRCKHCSREYRIYESAIKRRERNFERLVSISHANGQDPDDLTPPLK